MEWSKPLEWRAWHPSAMGFLDLPRPLGVFHVAFADFELRTYASDSDVKVGAAASRREAVSEVHDDDDDVERKECDEKDEETGAGRVEVSCRTPMLRFFLPYGDQTQVVFLSCADSTLVARCFLWGFLHVRFSYSRS